MISLDWFGFLATFRFLNRIILIIVKHLYFYGYILKLEGFDPHPPPLPVVATPLSGLSVT